MMSTPREKTLAILFASTLGIVGLWESLGSVMLQPLTDAQASVDAVRESLQSLKQQEAIVDHALRNLKQLAVAGLPSDSGEASSSYQGWLLSQLKKCEIENPIVSPGPAIQEDAVGARIPFVVQFSAASVNIAAFLDRFHSTPLLHRITNLHIVRSVDDDTDHRVMLSIEALAVGESGASESLPEPDAFENENSLATQIAQHDFFLGVDSASTQVADDADPVASTKTTTEIRQVETNSTPKIDGSLDGIRFIASVWNGNQRTAWLVDLRSMQEATVRESAEFTLAGVTGRVLTISDDSCHVSLNGREMRVSLGQTIKNGANILTLSKRED